MAQYEYKNILNKCPNCGGNLSPKDTDCPFCSINLVGYNEEYNREINIDKANDALESIHEENNKVNEKIEKDKRKKKRAWIIIAVIYGLAQLAALLIELIG